MFNSLYIIIYIYLYLWLFIYHIINFKIVALLAILYLFINRLQYNIIMAYEMWIKAFAYIYNLCKIMIITINCKLIITLLNEYTLCLWCIGRLDMTHNKYILNGKAWAVKLMIYRFIELDENICIYFHL